jgi:hypothetical protein
MWVGGIHTYVGGIHPPYIWRVVSYLFFYFYYSGVDPHPRDGCGIHTYVGGWSMWVGGIHTYVGG